MTSTELAYEKGLPANLDAERFVLGSILLNDMVYLQVAGAVEPDDFSLEKHRRIFARMKDLYDRGERLDRVTVANELMKQGQLESVDGLGYLVSLDDGLPEIANLESYIRIVKDKATLRKLIFAAQKVINRCLLGEDEPDEILSSAEDSAIPARARSSFRPRRCSRRSRAASMRFSIQHSGSKVSARASRSSMK
jgi:replicative DNA helicase